MGDRDPSGSPHGSISAQGCNVKQMHTDDTPTTLWSATPQLLVGLERRPSHHLPSRPAAGWFAIEKLESVAHGSRRGSSTRAGVGQHPPCHRSTTWSWCHGSILSPRRPLHGETRQLPFPSPTPSRCNCGVRLNEPVSMWQYRKRPDRRTRGGSVHSCCSPSVAWINMDPAAVQSKQDKVAIYLALPTPAEVRSPLPVRDLYLVTRSPRRLPSHTATSRSTPPVC